MFLVGELAHGIRKEIVKRHEIVTSLVEFLPITVPKGIHQVAHVYKVEIVVICPWLRMLVNRAEHRGGVDGLVAGFTLMTSSTSNMQFGAVDSCGGGVKSAALRVTKALS